MAAIGGVERPWPPALPVSHWRNGENRAPGIPVAMFVAAPPPSEAVSWPAWEQGHRNGVGPARTIPGDGEEDGAMEGSVSVSHMCVVKIDARTGERKERRTGCGRKKRGGGKVKRPRGWLGFGLMSLEP